MKLCWEAMGGTPESCMRGPLTGVEKFVEKMKEIQEEAKAALRKA